MGKKPTSLSAFEAFRNTQHVGAVGSPQFLFHRLLLKEASGLVGGRGASLPRPQAPFLACCLFNRKRQNFPHDPRDGACILNIRQLPLLFAGGFVSFHTSLQPPLCSEHTVPVVRREEGVQGLERASLVFPANSEQRQNRSGGFGRTETRGLDAEF